MLNKKAVIDEVQVWDQFRLGDQQAFTTLYQHFVQPLYAYSLGVTNDKELIKDCLHDLFVELWKNHATLGPTTSVKFYLMASIKRKIIRNMETSMKHYNHHVNYMKDFIEDNIIDKLKIAVLDRPENIQLYDSSYPILNVKRG